MSAISIIKLTIIVFAPSMNMYMENFWNPFALNAVGLLNIIFVIVKENEIFFDNVYILDWKINLKDCQYMI